MSNLSEEMLNWLRRFLLGNRAADGQLPDPALDPTEGTANEAEDLLLTAEDTPEAPGHWLGVGFDGTLAACPEGPPPEQPGPAVPNMVKRVQDWLDQGLTVKVFTWRGATEEGRAEVRAWLLREGLPELEVTDTKDFDMVEFWDCRGVQVIPNSGRPVGPTSLPEPPR